MQGDSVIRPYTVLTYYEPVLWRCWKIGRDLTRITRDLGFLPLQAEDSRYERAPWSDNRLHAHVRRRTLRSVAGEDWHQDGDYGHVPMDHLLAFWSSNTPTEIRDSTGRVWQPRPYELVIINNLEVFHRRPLDAPRRRWFFRQRLQVGRSNR